MHSTNTWKFQQCIGICLFGSHIWKHSIYFFTSLVEFYFQFIHIESITPSLQSWQRLIYISKVSKHSGKPSNESMSWSSSKAGASFLGASAWLPVIVVSTPTTTCYAVQPLEFHLDSLLYMLDMSVNGSWCRPGSWTFQSSLSFLTKLVKNMVSSLVEA